MDIFVVPACALAGVLAGALLPLWVARLPEPEHATAESKIPYARLARVPILPYAFAVATAGSFALLGWRLGPSPALVAELYLTAVGVLLCYVDACVRLLPNAVILPSYPIVIALLAIGAVISRDWRSFGWALACGAGLWLLFAITAFIYPAGVGFGDVKLVGLLGLGLGWFGLTYALVGVVLAFVLGGLVSLVLVVSRRASRKSHMPFGPFLVIGYLGALLFAQDLADWYLTR